MNTQVHNPLATNRGSVVRLLISVGALALALGAFPALVGGAAAGQPERSIPELTVGQVAVAQDADAGAEVFAENCATCHQASGEGIVGTFPPLAGNPDVADATYVEGIVRNGLAGPLEVLGVAYDGKMASFDQLSDEEVSAVAAFVSSLADVDTSSTPSSEAPVAEPGDAAQGRELFVGSTRFDNGASACASCHTAGDVGNLGGWSLGPDLTNVHQTLGGDVGLSAWLSSPASATMRPIFGERPLSEPEIADVVAFLGDAPTQTKPTDPGDGLIYAGVTGLLVLIGGMAIAWRGMRQTYMQRLRSKR